MKGSGRYAISSMQNNAVLERGHYCSAMNSITEEQHAENERYERIALSNRQNAVGNKTRRKLSEIDEENEQEQ